MPSATIETLRPGGTKATLIVTMTLADLLGERGSARVLGTTAHDTHLPPDVARRLACDAGIIPAVLSGAGELLDLGRETRFFTPAQIRALWLRDGGCSYPECTMPAHYCDAHHLHHWADFGTTDLDNATLLCPHHHDTAHRHRLAGYLDDGAIRWNLTPGSYDTHHTTRQPTG